jgi:DNA-binding MarR family transcriptional regulator
MDIEARAHSEHPEALRLWLRLLTCTQLVEKQVRTLLRERFDTTLPRFDLMAQLERAPAGLKMNELSRRMMVTGGNVTGITDQLAAEGLVERIDVEGDRRACRVRLTRAAASSSRRWRASTRTGSSRPSPASATRRSPPCTSCWAR